MQQRSRWLASSIILAFGLRAVGDAGAAEVCWVDHVAKAGDEVAVYFIANGPYSVQVLPQDIAAAGVWLLQAGKLSHCLDPAARRCSFADDLSVDHLTLPAGAQISAHITPEDQCTLTVVVDQQRTGLEARISQHLPGLPGVQQTRLIPVR